MNLFIIALFAFVVAKASAQKDGCISTCQGFKQDILGDASVCKPALNIHPIPQVHNGCVRARKDAVDKVCKAMCNASDMKTLWDSVVKDCGRKGGSRTAHWCRRGFSSVMKQLQTALDNSIAEAEPAKFSTVDESESQGSRTVAKKPSEENIVSGPRIEEGIDKKSEQEPGPNRKDVLWSNETIMTFASPHGISTSSSSEDIIPPIKESFDDQISSNSGTTHYLDSNELLRFDTNVTAATPSFEAERVRFFNFYGVHPQQWLDKIDGHVTPTGEIPWNKYKSSTSNEYGKDFQKNDNVIIDHVIHLERRMIQPQDARSPDLINLNHRQSNATSSLRIPPESKLFVSGEGRPDSEPNAGILGLEAPGTIFSLIDTVSNNWTLQLNPSVNHILSPRGFAVNHLRRNDTGQVDKVDDVITSFELYFDTNDPSYDLSKNLQSRGRGTTRTWSSQPMSLPRLWVAPNAVNFTLLMSLDKYLNPADKSPMLWSITRHVLKAKYLVKIVDYSLTLIFLLLAYCCDFVGANESIASDSDKAFIGTDDSAMYEEEKGVAVLAHMRLHQESRVLHSDLGTYWRSPSPHTYRYRRRSSRTPKPPDRCRRLTDFKAARSIHTFVLNMATSCSCLLPRRRIPFVPRMM